MPTRDRWYSVTLYYMDTVLEYRRIAEGSEKARKQALLAVEIADTVIHINHETIAYSRLLREQARRIREQCIVRAINR